jgi:hypothetical protein
MDCPEASGHLRAMVVVAGSLMVEKVRSEPVRRA